MKLTDEAVEAAAKAIFETPHDQISRNGYERAERDIQDLYRAEARLALLAALPHLTDDGAAATPPTEGAANTPAAESATPVGAGAAAPSSPHQVTALLASTVFHCFDHEEFGLSAKHATAVSDALVAAGFFGEGATPATNHRPTCGTTYGESCDGYCPTPAIDREALTELLRFNRHAPYVSNERLADMAAELIGAPAIDREQISERLAEAMADSWMGDEVDCADVATILTPAVLALIEGAQ